MIPDGREICACSLSGMISEKGRKISGEDIIKSIAIMNERSNGLGGGFAAYGIYPDYEDFYALHLMFDDITSKESTQHFLNQKFSIEMEEKIPTRKADSIKDPPLLWRYFLKDQWRCFKRWKKCGL